MQAKMCFEFCKALQEWQVVVIYYSGGHLIFLSQMLGSIGGKECVYSGAQFLGAKLNSRYLQGNILTSNSQTVSRAKAAWSSV